MSLTRSRAYLYLHIAIFLFGFTAILGKGISLSGLNLTWWRMVITLASLLLFPGILKKVRQIPKSDILRILGIGLIISLHWVTFFTSIKLSNVSVTLSVIASTAFFTALIEPIVFKRKVRIYEMILGGLVIVGFVFIFRFTGHKMMAGILAAICSALLAAAFGVFNKKMVDRYDVYAITLVEFVAGVTLLSLIVGTLMGLHHFFPEALTAIMDDASQLRFLPTQSDWVYLLILALVCTTFAYTLQMRALREISAFTVALSINLEPIYGIIMAWFIFQEHKELNAGFYAGAGIILLSVFLNPWMAKRFG